MFEILVAGAIGAVYGLCLDYNLRYSQRKQKKKEDCSKPRKLSTDEAFSLLSERQAEEEKQQTKIIIIKDSKVYLVKGGGHEQKRQF